MIVSRDISITQIAYQYGYSNSSSFSKAFKRHFNMSPQEYRKARKDKQRNDSLTIMWLGGISMEIPTIEIKEIEFKVIYVRFKGSYLEFRKNAMKMFKKLEKYAIKHNLLVDQFTKVMTLYHDNPFITDQDNLRTSVALSVPLSFNVKDEDEIRRIDDSRKVCSTALFIDT
jgi:hypothetical protein